MSPKAYVHMKEAFIDQGMSKKSAQAKAAAIYNAKHPDAPVTGKHKAGGKGCK